MSSWQLNPILQPPRHLTVVFIWAAHTTAWVPYSLLECPNVDSGSTLVSSTSSTVWPRASHSGCIWEGTGQAAWATAWELRICHCCRPPCDYTKHLWQWKEDRQTKTPSSRQPTEERPMMSHPQAFWVQATLLIPWMVATCYSLWYKSYLALSQSVLFHSTKVLLKKKIKKHFENQWDDSVDKGICCQA